MELKQSYLLTSDYYHSNQCSVALVLKQTHRSLEQNRKPRNKPHTYDQFIYNRGSKDVQWRKNSLFSKWYWKNWAVMCKRMKLEHSLTPYTKVNSKWTKDLIVKLETTKLLE